MGIIDEVAFVHHTRLGRVWPTIPCHAYDVAVYQALGNGDGSVTRIKANSVYLKTKAINLAIKTGEVNAAIIDISGRCVGICNDIKGAIDRAVIEVKEAFGLAFAHHIAAIRVGG